MRAPLLLRILVPILALAACGTDPGAISGDLAEGAEATHVWVLGQAARAAVAEDSFRLEGIEGDVLDLRFAADGDEVARMEIRGHPGGGRIVLRGIWFDDGIAHPSAVETGGGDVLTVNGLRMAAGEGLRGRVETEGEILSVSREGDALVLRAGDGSMPDLRVVVTPGTRLTTPDGDPASAERLEPGDSVRVVGQSEAGYLIASELVVPRGRARGR